jgi:hypothetical protein
LSGYICQNYYRLPMHMVKLLVCAVMAERGCAPFFVPVP